MYWTLENVPWTNLHDLNLDWIVNTMKQTVEQWIAYRAEMDQNYEEFTTQINDDFDSFTAGINDDFDSFTAGINEWKTLIETEFNDLQTYVQNYFDNLDLNESTRYVINQMIASGEFIQVLNPSIVSATEAWLASHVTPTTPVVDDTLTISGAAADAKVTGEEFDNANSDLLRLADLSYLIDNNKMPVNWFERGTITNGVNDNYRPGSRARTIKTLQFDSFCVLTVTSGYYFVVFYYDDNSHTDSGWKTSNDIFTIPANQKFRIIVTPDNGAPAEDVYPLHEITNPLVFLPDATETNSINIFNMLFEHGNINQGADDNWNTASRCRTTKIYSYPYSIQLSMTTGSYAIHFYDDNDVFTIASAWRTTEKYKIPPYTKFRLVLSLTPATNTFAKLSDIVSNLQIEPVIYNDTINPFNMQFEHGSLLNGADDSFYADARCRMTEICNFPFSVSVSMITGSYAIHFYDDNGTFTINTAWRTTEEFTIPAYTKFRLVITLNPNSNNYVNLSDLLTNLQIKQIPYNTPLSLAPNIIFASRNVDDTAIPPESKWYVKAAANNQYDRVRFTVRVTTDGIFFNCHDDYINNYVVNPDGTPLAEQVPANGQTLADLNQYDWGLKYGQRYAGATVPTLEEGLKFAALYNLGVTWHSASSQVETDENIAEQLKLMDKYGVTDNLIVITASDQNFATARKFQAHNPRISFYFGGDETWITSHVNDLKSLQTDYNKIYLQLHPWGTAPTPTLIEFAKSNNFMLYNSIVMSRADLLSLDTFNKGYTYIEVNNVTNIKDTIRNWVNSLIT